MQAMIFAAGMGTRLRPLTDRMPKALVPVGDKPLLWHVIMKLHEAGADKMVVNVHHFASQIIDYLSRNHNFGFDISISDETSELLDTGGGLRHAAGLFRPGEPVLVHNVDILSNVDLARFYAHAPEADAVLLVSHRQTQRYLLFDDEMKLVGWVNVKTGEVKSPHEAVRAQSVDSLTRRYHTLAFAGIHTVGPRALSEMSQWPDRFGIIDFYLRSCHRLSIVGCEADNLRLLDVGKLDTLAEADHFLSTLTAERP